MDGEGEGEGGERRASRDIHTYNTNNKGAYGVYIIAYILYNKI